MLKKYATPCQLRFVGKAWEIRQALRQEQKRKGGDMTLAALLRHAVSPGK
ncbi:Z-ring formation inhibitor MciZ [Cohnella sp. GCM10027633]